MTLYRDDLARIQAEAFGEYAHRMMPRVLELLGPGDPKTRVLDIGCGAGISTRALLAHGFQVVALEPSQTLISHARELAPEATFLCSSVWDGVLPACTAALAIGEPLTYHPRDVDGGARLRGLLDYFQSALPAGGRFIFDFIEAEGAPLDAKRFRSEREWVLLYETVEDRTAHRLTRTIDTFTHVDALELDVWRREREVHEVVLFARAEVAKWLDAAGFDAELTDADPALPRRVLVSATRRA